MKAQQIDMLLLGFGTDYAGGTVAFKNSGLTTDKDAYSTNDPLGATVANPYTLDANGRTVPIYGSGWYKLIIAKADSTGVLTFDGLYYGVLEQTDPRGPNVRSISSNDTILDADDVILSDASGGAIVATLDDAANFSDYRIVTLKKQDATANTVTLKGYGTQTIDGANTKVLSRQYQSITVVKISSTQWAAFKPFSVGDADQVDGFDASVTPTASTVVVSNASGKIDDNWIDKAVLADVADTTHDYLSGKVDNATIEVDTAAHVLRIKPTTGIGTGQLKNSTFEASSTSGNVAVTGGQWCHWPQVKSDGGNGTVSVALSYAGTSYATIVSITNDSLTPPNTTYALFLYHTSSGDQVWIFRLRDKSTGITLATTIGVDHPCFAGTGDPKLTPHPFVNYDPLQHDILISTPSWETVNEIIANSGESSVLEVINRSYEMVEDDTASWPSQPIAVSPGRAVIIEKESYFKLCRVAVKSA